MIRFQVEPWSAIRAEMEPMLLAHWQEVALHQDKIPLAPDWSRYGEFEKAGALHIVTVRDEARLVGYHVTVVAPHLHYRTTLVGQTDIYRLLPEYRAGATGIQMFQFAEKTLRARGVQIMSTSTKLHRDVGSVFEYLGWQEIERVFSKWVGD